jgi:low temperature requirement protein LtrA
MDPTPSIRRTYRQRFSIPDFDVAGLLFTYTMFVALGLLSDQTMSPTRILVYVFITILIPTLLVCSETEEIVLEGP